MKQVCVFCHLFVKKIRMPPEGARLSFHGIPTRTTKGTRDTWWLLGVSNSLSLKLGGGCPCVLLQHPPKKGINKKTSHLVEVNQSNLQGWTPLKHELVWKGQAKFGRFSNKESDPENGRCPLVFPSKPSAKGSSYLKTDAGKQWRESQTNQQQSIRLIVSQHHHQEPSSGCQLEAVAINQATLPLARTWAYFRKLDRPEEQA